MLQTLQYVTYVAWWYMALLPALNSTTLHAIPLSTEGIETSFDRGTWAARGAGCPPGSAVAARRTSPTGRWWTRPAPSFWRWPPMAWRADASRICWWQHWPNRKMHRKVSSEWIPGQFGHLISRAARRSSLRRPAKLIVMGMTGRSQKGIYSSATEKCALCKTMKARVQKMFGSPKKTSPNLRVLRSTEKNAALTGQSGLHWWKPSSEKIQANIL